MRLGMLPSQQRALSQGFKKARKFDEFRGRTRRGFLLMAVAGCGASVAAFFVGHGSAAKPRPAQVPEAALTQARKLAVGPLADLVASHPTFLLVLERAGDDVALWAGYARLVDVAVQERHAILARHLLESSAAAPPTLTPMHSLLQPIAQR